MTATFELINQNLFKISGSLDAGSVNALLPLGTKAISTNSHQELVIDLSDVTDSSSAGVALLVAWWKVTKLHHKVLRLKNIPTKMHAIMRVSNLDELLETN